MPAMSRLEQAFCRGALWRRFTQRFVLPWALQRRTLHGGVLEIGGGDGSMAEALLERTPDVVATVTDYDAGMVKSARQRLARFDTRVKVEQADATVLPYPDDTFDAVMSFIMLHHVIDWEAAIGEAVRVLRPGGLVLGYDLVESWPTRAIHKLDRSRARPMRVEELRAQAQRLPIKDARIREALGGLVVRFTFTKSMAASGCIGAKP